MCRRICRHSCSTCSLRWGLHSAALCVIARGSEIRTRTSGSHRLVARRVGTVLWHMRSQLPTAGGAATAPPFALPVAHFAAALAWLVVAAVLMPSVAPRLARGAVFDPTVLALVHVFTLGVVATAIFGTLQQFIPVGLGVPLRSARLGWIGLWALQLGVVLLVCGFWWWRGVAQALGWVCVFIALGAVGIRMGTLRRPEPPRPIAKPKTDDEYIR